MPIHNDVHSYSKEDREVMEVCSVGVILRIATNV